MVELWEEWGVSENCGQDMMYDRIKKKRWRQENEEFKVILDT